MIKILTVRDKIQQSLPSTGPDLSTNSGTLEAAVKPDIHLDCFSPIDFPELTSTISSSKPSTCLLDPIPTRLLKDVLPLISTSLLNMINLSLVIGYVPQSCNVALKSLMIRAF